MKVKFFELIFPPMVILSAVSSMLSLILVVHSSFFYSMIWFLVLLVSVTLARKGYFEEVERENLYTLKNPRELNKDQKETD